MFSPYSLVTIGRSNDSPRGDYWPCDDAQMPRLCPSLVRPTANQHHWDTVAAARHGRPALSAIADTNWDRSPYYPIASLGCSSTEAGGGCVYAQASNWLFKSQVMANSIISMVCEFRNRRLGGVDWAFSIDRYPALPGEGGQVLTVCKASPDGSTCVRSSSPPRTACTWTQCDVLLVRKGLDAAPEGAIHYVGMEVHPDCAHPPGAHQI